MVAELVVGARDGFSLAVQTAGPVDGPVLVLLPGQANSHRWWSQLRPRLQDRFRTVTFDYRGTGRSRGSVDRWSTASFAADTVDVLDGLGVEQAAVYGTSMGGRVAQMVAIDHSDRVTAMVVASSSPGGADAVERSSELRRSLARSTPTARRRLLHDLFYTPSWPHPPEDSVLLGDPSMTNQETTAHLRASDGHNPGHRLDLVGAPTLVLHGADDQMTPVVNASLLAERIPQAQLQIFPTGRHGFFDEFADQVTPVVLDFLSRRVER